MDSLRGLWQQSPAVQQLQQGCARLGLHPDALELVAFLRLKVDLWPAGANMPPHGLSPGTRIDHLWHWMLLNTRVARGVYDLIGGEVDHASTDEEDLADDIKVLRRLAALNLLAAKGWTPTLGFWEEPGTMLHSLRCITYGAPQVKLYVHSGATQALCRTLEQLLPPPFMRSYNPHAQADYFQQAWALAAHPRDADGPAFPARATLVFQLQPEQQAALPRLQDSTTVTMPWGRHYRVGDLYLGAAWYLSASEAPTQAELEAVAGQLRLVQGSCFADMSTRLLHVGLQEGRVVHVLQPGQEPLPGLNIGIKTLTGKVSALLVPHTQLLVKELKQLVTDREGIPTCQQRLVFRCQQLDDDCTLEEYQLQDGDVIHLVLRLSGC